MATLEHTISERTENKQQDASRNAEMQRRKESVMAFRDNYWSLMNKTGFGSKSSTLETIRWLNDMKLTDDTSEQRSIHWREDFIKKDGTLVLQQGESLYQTFTAHMANAAPYISKESYNRWFDRLYDTREQSSSTSSFKMKMAWVQSELGNYVSRWKKVAEERDELVKNSRFKDLVAAEPDLAILSEREKFLNMHYTERRGLVSKALGLINAKDTSRMDLFGAAKSKLESAAGKEFILKGKVGVWLERIFKSKADPKKIAEFVNGSGPKSLEGLIGNWAAVKQRYDNVDKKFRERFDSSGIRGFQMFNKTQFLGLHYAQRLRFVEQAEDRLDAANDVENEAPILLRLRHAIDTKDWEEAVEIIGQAKTEGLSEKNFKRLKSMESYVKQFSGVKEIKGRKPDVTEAKKRIDAIVEEIGQHHSEVQPMVIRLLRGPNANRSIHQFRWIVYNNDWCTTHGYLNHDIAKKGASQQNEEATRENAKTGEDIGRHDVQSHSTDGNEHIRKTEHADHTATFRHVNVASGGATQRTAAWLEHDQNPKVLYWTTFCAHENGEPKPHNWHRDLLTNLTELRSLARTVNNSGFLYDGPGRPLIGLN